MSSTKCETIYKNLLDQALNLLQQFLQNPAEDDAKWMIKAKKFVNNAEAVHEQLNSFHCNASYWDHIQTVNTAITDDMFARGTRYALLANTLRPNNAGVVELAKEAGIQDANQRVFDNAMDTSAMEREALERQIQKNRQWQATWKLR